MARYSETLMFHFLAPRNSGRVDNPDRIGAVGRPGETLFMVVYLRIRDARVERATYQTNGCGASIAAGSVLTEMVAGRPIAECLPLTPDDVAAALDGVPPDKRHCPVLAITALGVALAPYVRVVHPRGVGRGGSGCAFGGRLPIISPWTGPAGYLLRGFIS